VIRDRIQSVGRYPRSRSVRQPLRDAFEVVEFGLWPMRFVRDVRGLLLGGPAYGERPACEVPHFCGVFGPSASVRAAPNVPYRSKFCGFFER
jgi:hypothetical protein